MRFSPVLLLAPLVTACASLEPETETLTLYCYATLADPACYLAPDADREGRLIAVTEVPATPELQLLRTAAERRALLAEARRELR